MGVKAPFNPGPNRRQRRWKPSHRVGTKAYSRGRVKSGVYQAGCFGKPAWMRAAEA